MAEFKTLGEMKIRNPHEIQRYSLQTVERSDEVRRLEEDSKIRLDYIRSLVDSI